MVSNPIEPVGVQIEQTVERPEKPKVDLGIDFGKFNSKSTTVSEIKKEIDRQNKYIRGLHESIIITENGVKLITNEDITGLDQASNNVAQLQEILRRRVEKDLIEFREVRYPLISEIEQYGIMSDYFKKLFTDKFFEVKENEEYEDTRVEYNYFKDISLEKYIEFVEAMDFLNLENTQVLFSPYKILSSYAYCEDYTPKDLNIRRTRVYNNPQEGEDIASTLYHELGHMVYFELVENNEENYNKYYNIYKQEFDKNEASDRYGRWDRKLTENFAEDFKIYVTKKVMLENEELGKHIKEREKSFLGKTTVYPIKFETDRYFEELLKGYSINTKSLRPDIRLKVEDYVEGFNLYDTSYLNQHSNKIVSNSNKVRVEFNGEETEVVPVRYLVRTLNFETYDLEKEKEYKIKEGTKEIEVKTSEKKIYEIEIELQDKEGKYTESVVYYIIKM